MQEDLTKILSVRLLRAGLTPVLGTMESVVGDMIKKSQYVKKGAPFSIGFRNQVVVIYDEQGRPWVARTTTWNSDHAVNNETIVKVVEELGAEFQLKHDAYVPHSGDGLEFLGKILPNL